MLRGLPHLQQTVWQTDCTNEISVPARELYKPIFLPCQMWAGNSSSRLLSLSTFCFTANTQHGCITACTDPLQSPRSLVNTACFTTQRPRIRQLPTMMVAPVWTVHESLSKWWFKNVSNKVFGQQIKETSFYQKQSAIWHKGTTAEVIILSISQEFNSEFRLLMRHLWTKYVIHWFQFLKCQDYALFSIIFGLLVWQKSNVTFAFLGANAKTHSSYDCTLG